MRRVIKTLSVSLLIGQLNLGGAEKQLVLLARELHERGMKVRVIVLFEAGPRKDDLGDVPLVVLGFREPRRLAALPRNVLAFVKLVRELRREKPDVLHAWLTASYIIAAPAAKLAGVPLLAARRSLGTFKEGMRLVLFAERIANRMTRHVIANARAVADDVIRQERLDPKKISVIYNGIPAGAFEVEPLPTDVPTILCVANLFAYKGHAHLFDALAELRSRGVKCRTILIGDGPARAALERRARELGLGPDGVVFEGQRRDTPAYLASCDVFVLPSLTEGMSNAVMEAMAAGRPIVATAVGGTPELLRGDQSGEDRGLLVPPGDGFALADALERLLTDQVEAQRLGSAARAWSRAHLRVGAMTDAHIRIYRRFSCAE